MITIIASTAAAILILALSHLVFVVYPKSAISMARHNLFNLRDELFELAQDGEMDFNSAGYKAVREMINGLIRYAHDVSLMQIFTTQLIVKLRGQRITTAEWDSAIGRLNKHSRAHAERIVRQAMMHMIRLLVTKSVILSSIFAMAVMAHAASLQAARLASAAASLLRQPNNCEPNLGSSDAVLRDVLAKPSGARFKIIVKNEARRYTSPGFGLNLAAA